MFQREGNLRGPEILLKFPGAPLTEGKLYDTSVRTDVVKHVPGAHVAGNDESLIAFDNAPAGGLSALPLLVSVILL